MWVFPLFLTAIALIIFFCVGNAFKLRKKLVKTLQFKNKSSKVDYSIFRAQESSFQKWVIDYCQVKDPSELKGNFKEAFQKDDWNLLDPSVYSKWSKFKWGI